MASEAADDVASTGGQSFESAAASTGIAGGQQGAAGEQGAPSHQSLGNGSATGITKPKMGGVTFCDDRRVAYTGGVPLADWSGLDTEFAAVGHEDPNQLRSEKVSIRGRRASSRSLAPSQIFVASASKSKSTSTPTAWTPSCIYLIPSPAR